MSSNVGLPTPRGSGTSGYVQRNHAFMKPRNAGYGAPYPPLSADSATGGFKQRQPDRKILEHDRLREVEVRVMEERERLEGRNEEVEAEMETEGRKGSEQEGAEEGETTESPSAKDKNTDEKRILSDEEIDQCCEALRAKLLKDLEDEDARPNTSNQRSGGRRGKDAPKERKQFKAYQVHELAEAKIEESERLRRALGIQEDRETGEIKGSVGGFGRDRR